MVRDTLSARTDRREHPGPERQASGHHGQHLDPRRRRSYTCRVGTKDITNEFVRKVADDLRSRYSLDDDAVRALGARLAGSTGVRSAQNTAFAERFVEEHRETFDRLAQ
jgi:hypothetical protein